MDLTDEEFLAQFEALSANEEAINLPQNAEHNRHWTNCLLARVTTTRVITENYFSVNMRKVPVNLKTQGSFMAYVVHEGMGNICMFCAKVGHDQIQCSSRMRVMRIRRQEGKFLNRIQKNNMMDSKVGCWITDKTLVREKIVSINLIVAKMERGQVTPVITEVAWNSSKTKEKTVRTLKRVMHLNTEHNEPMDGGQTSHNVAKGGSNTTVLQINYKRSKEAISNSPPSLQ